MSEKKKYTYIYDRVCENCGKQYQTTRYSSKMCSEECVKIKLSKKRKYTEEQVAKAIELKLQGFSSKEIKEQTGIKKSTQDNIFKENNIRLNEEQKQKLLHNRWKDHDPIKNGQKQCSKCGKFKDLEEFHKNNNRITKVVSSCKECYQKFYSTNDGEIKKRVNIYRKNNLEKIRENGKIFYENNKEIYIAKASKWSVENPEKRKEIEKKYRSNNKGLHNKRTAEYRARKKKALPNWLNEEQHREIALIYKNRPEGFHVDHIVPIGGENVCGLHVPWNLQYLGEYQNESKGNKFFDENVTVSEECHQYKRKLETLEEDRAAGMPLGEPLDNFTFAQEKRTSEHSKFIERYEWLGTVGYSPKWFFTARVNGVLGGVVIISEPNGYTKSSKLEALISRGATASWTPKNLGSKLVMYSCRWMVENTSKRVFFGYSDHSAGEIGTIYQACNFIYLGRHFGAKNKYILSNGKTVSGRYFTKTSTFKKYALELGIPWQPEWLKENKYMDIKAIPEEVLGILRDKAAMEKGKCEKVDVQPKSKYALIMGASKKEKKNIHEIYDKVFGKGLPYPKRMKE